MENFTNDDFKLIIEALLFTGSVQVFSEHDDKQSKQMVELAKKLYSKTKPELNSIYFLVETEYEEEYANDIANDFPTVPHVSIKDIV